MRSDAPAKESQRTGVADLIAELTVQIDNVRRIFDGSFDGSQNRRTAATSRDADVVFIDDLAHCMECSWAKQHETIGIQLDADAVAQCNLLLETSLRVLKRIETMQPRSNTPPAT
jgi:hypothetical protein